MPVDAVRSVADHMDYILRQVHPKRLVSEIARLDKGAFFRNFKGFRPEKIGRGRVKKAVDREVLTGTGNAVFANLLIVHWNEAFDVLYQEMVQHVQAINEDVEAIEEITDDQAHPIIDDLAARHSLEDILVCVRLNGVRFRDELVESRLVREEAAPASVAVEDAPLSPA